ncbi:MAG: hypothetical protein ACYSPJ_00525 [Planctomycetota bacterium]|jgi:hypothetical protein
MSRRLAWTGNSSPTSSVTAAATKTASGRNKTGSVRLACMVLFIIGAYYTENLRIFKVVL